ncbi:Telomeric repeat-binding factor 2 [Massospora cicadina]|nr:Telomeric repeat-binding factor 2 [Massospora cicadina]
MEGHEAVSWGNAQRGPVSGSQLAYIIRVIRVKSESDADPFQTISTPIQKSPITEANLPVKTEPVSHQFGSPSVTGVSVSEAGREFSPPITNEATPTSRTGSELGMSLAFVKSETNSDGELKQTLISVSETETCPGPTGSSTFMSGAKVYSGAEYEGNAAVTAEGSLENEEPIKAKLPDKANQRPMSEMVPTSETSPATKTSLPEASQTPEITSEAKEGSPIEEGVDASFKNALSAEISATETNLTLGAAEEVERSSPNSTPRSACSPILLPTPIYTRGSDLCDNQPTNAPQKWARFAYVDGARFPPPPLHITPSLKISAYLERKCNRRKKARLAYADRAKSPPSSINPFFGKSVRNKSLASSLASFGLRRQRFPWSPSEVIALERLAAVHGVGNWATIRAQAGNSIHPSRTNVHLKDKWRNLYKMGQVHKASKRTIHPWTLKETESVRQGVEQFGVGSWARIAQDPTLASRTPTQIKDRWRAVTHLPNRGVRTCTPWSEVELAALRTEVERNAGGGWAKIAEHPALKSRTVLQIKDKWRHLKSKPAITGKAFLVLDSHHLPYRALSGAVRVYRNEQPLRAALKAFTKPYLYLSGTEDNPSKKVTVRILQLCDAQRPSSSVRVYYGSRRLLASTSTNLNFTPKWTAEATFSGVEPLLAPIQLHPQRLSHPAPAATPSEMAESDAISDLYASSSSA